MGREVLPLKSAPTGKETNEKSAEGSKRRWCCQHCRWEGFGRKGKKRTWQCFSKSKETLCRLAYRGEGRPASWETGAVSRTWSLVWYGMVGWPESRVCIDVRTIRSYGNPITVRGVRGTVTERGIDLLRSENNTGTCFLGSWNPFFGFEAKQLAVWDCASNAACRHGRGWADAHEWVVQEESGMER